MRRILLLVNLCLLTFYLPAQRILPPGVEAIGGATPSMSFLLKDRNNIIWEGVGGLNSQWNRADKGLMQYKNKQWLPVYTSGIFTDAIEIDTVLYFTTFEGLYKYQAGKFSIDYGAPKGNCIAYFKNKIMVGSEGRGLFEKTATGFKNDSIVINGRRYDTINCMTTKGGILWIGTTNGLLKYDGSKFSQYSLPITDTKNWLENYKQRSIKSIQIDADDRVWVLNNNRIDTSDCIYVFENGQFQSGRDHYTNQCLTKNLFPYSARNLGLDKSGHVIISMAWGVLKLGKDSIESYLLEFPSVGRDFLKISSYNQFCYTDKNGLIYTNLYGIGYATLDISQFDIKALLQDGNMALNRIDINDIKATISNVGIHFPVGNFRNPTLNLPNFEVPSVGCATPVFSAAIWMGGKDMKGNLHMSAETYRKTGFDYKPGPIDLITKVYDSITNSKYNKIWKMDRQTIDEFLKNRKLPFYVIPKSILEWPAHGTDNFDWHMAPYVDVDKNDKYEPEKGDYPQIKGDQMLWWVFNDLGAHTETKGQSLGVEIHGSCYAYNYRDLPSTDTNAIINRTLFFDYKIINRSEDDYKDFYVGLWTDPDLGNYADDYIGVDSIKNTGYCYNRDNFDEGRIGYGKNPPVFFCKMLNKNLNSFFYYNNNTDPINGNPDSAKDYYKYMTKRYPFQITEAIWVKTKSGKDSGISYPIPFGRICKDSMFLGKNTNSPADRRFLMSSYLPNFKKDSIYDIEFAYTLLHDPNIDFLKQACDLPGQVMHRLQNWYDNNTFPSKPYYGVGVKNIVSAQNDFLIYPNPTNGAVNIKTDVESKAVIGIQVFDISGKCIYQKLNTDELGSFNTTIDINGYASGIYLIKIQTNAGALIGKVIKE